MLGRIRWRMIFFAMVAFTAVMLLLVTLITVGSYSVQMGRIDQTIDGILRYEEQAGSIQPPVGCPAMPMPEPGNDFFMTQYFAVRLDGDGQVMSVLTDFLTSVSDSQAAEYAEKALNSGKTDGYLEDYRYAVRQREDGTVVAFLNVESERDFVRTLFTLSALVALVSLAVVFVLVFLLSKLAIRPFAQNLEQQKRFITDAGHELKTPLTSISTSLDVVELEVGENEWLDNIRHQTNRMTKLVAELVTLSRLDEVNPIPDREEFSLSDAAWETAEPFRSQAEAKGKTFDLSIDEDVTIYGDRSSIQQMMSVLLDNAVRYSDEGGKIRFTVTRKKGKTVIETFNTCHYDTPPDTKRLFDRFYRPDESRSANTGGTGVGLAIAKSAAEAHGGKITAECPDGRAMTVRVII